MNKEKLAALVESAKKALNNAKDKVVAFAKSTKDKAVELWNKIVAKTKDLVAAIVAWWNKLTTGAKAGVIAAVAVVVIVPIVLAIALGGNTPEPTPDPVPTAKTYTLVVVTDSDVTPSYGKAQVANHVLALVYDEDGKIVDARLDCAQIQPTLNENGEIVTLDSVPTKVELKEEYGPMPAGTWYVQSAAFEALIIGKTAEEVAALAVEDVYAAGCTMVGTTPVFLELVAKAFAYENTVTFTTAEDFKLGVAATSTVGASRGGVAVTSNFAGVVVVGDTVAAVMLDVVEQKYTIVDGALVAPETPAVSKNDQGEGYTGMPAGPWYKQARAFAASAVGKTVAELADLELTSEALVAAGCTMQGTADYKAPLLAAAGYAK